MKESKEGFVYFIQNKTNSLVKIGFTTHNPYVRLAAIQNTTPDKLDLICLIRGSQTLEKSLHVISNKFRQWGEWFTPEVLSLCENFETLSLAKYKASYSAPGAKAELARKRNPVFLNENLAYLFKLKNLSKIARELDISKSLLADWVAYRRQPALGNMAIVKLLAEYTGHSFEDLIFRDLRKKSA